MSSVANWTWISAHEMIASTDVPSPAVLLFRAEGGELALKESFPVEESVFNIARSGDGATAAVQVMVESSSSFQVLLGWCLENGG